MAWIYLAESEDSVWPLHHGSDQSPTVKKTNMLKLFYCLGCDAINFLPPQYGMTSPHSYLSCCPERKLISSTADFHAKILALQELEKAWHQSEADFILKLKGSSKRLSLNSFFSKMYRQLGLEGLMKSSNHLPNSGMTVDGQLYQPQRLVPSILENDGSYLPTPTACDYGKNNGRNSKDQEKSRDRWSLTVRARRGKINSHVPGRLNPQWLEMAMGYPLQWTEIAPWAIQWCRGKREKLLKD